MIVYKGLNLYPVDMMKELRVNEISLPIYVSMMRKIGLYLKTCEIKKICQAYLFNQTSYNERVFQNMLPMLRFEL